MQYTLPMLLHLAFVQLLLPSHLSSDLAPRLSTRLSTRLSPTSWIEHAGITLSSPPDNQAARASSISIAVLVAVEWLSRQLPLPPQPLSDASTIN